MGTMTEKLTRGRRHARAALDAYTAAIESDPEAGNADSDDLANLGDLLADLLHLAEELHTAAEAEEGCEVAYDGAVTVTGIARLALDHYEYESDPDNADEEV